MPDIHVTTEGVFKLLKKLNINKVSKGAKIRNRYNQVPHLTQDTNGKAINPQLDTTNESQEVSPFPAGDPKAHVNRRAQRHSKHKTEKKHIKDPQKKYRLGTVSKIFYWRALTSLTVHTNPTLSSDVDQDTYTAQLKFSTDFNMMPHFQ